MQRKPAQTKCISLKSLEETGRFTGYGAKFGNIDHGGDIILPGAFAKSLERARGQVKILWQHQMNNPIGVPVDLKEDGEGLYTEGALVMEVQQAREALALAKAGALGGMSIGYIPEDWSWDNGIRILKQVELLEVSLVTFPMNDQATILSAKAAFESLKSLADCEALLRDAGGFSHTEAKTLLSHLRTLFRVDAESEAKALAEQAEVAAAIDVLLNNTRQ